MNSIIIGQKRSGCVHPREVARSLDNLELRDAFAQGVDDLVGGAWSTENAGAIWERPALCV